MNERVQPLSIKTFRGKGDRVGTETERISWRDWTGESKKEEARQNEGQSSFLAFSGGQIAGVSDATGSPNLFPIRQTRVPPPHMTHVLWAPALQGQASRHRESF